MADKSILVVDDVPVNLKLTDILLRREGFKVHTSSDAEQALALLRGFHPDLMLVDIELPGMDGFSLTRRIKENPSTKDIVVIALSARASSGDDQKAYAAGCDGYITKPIDSATLVSSIRGHLNRQPGNLENREQERRRTMPTAEVTAVDEDDIETLRRRFLEEGALQSRQMLESLTKNFEVQKSARLLHSWVGAAGILGYMAISNLARQAEEALSVTPPDQEILCESLSDLALAFQDPLETTPQQQIPVSITQALASQPIGLLGFGADEMERVCSALEHVGARPRLFHPADPLNTGSVQDCRAMLMAVTADTLNSPWLAADAPLSAQQPLVLAGKREQIMGLSVAQQSRASEFLIDGWQPEEALLRLSFAITRTNRNNGGVTRSDAPVSELTAVPGSPDIVIADDDAVVRSAVRLALQDYGMKCHMAENGTAALQMIRQQRPPAAVLDVNMPGMDGYLVLAAVRQEKIPTRVVLLTARKHENDISRGFNLGADDYLVKPFNPVELVARLKRLLRR
ncbi:MAG TPA: response regulator [Bryobacteraceae bacterium]|jgi:DNA-binding response OmpR family regulator|nr:response regulator [Bryobacteraceae bacterium]